MVFGNRGARSGSGVCFTRDPATGHRGVYGDYLTNAQGEDVVAGIRNTVPLTDLADLDPTSYEQLLEVMATLERHYQDLCDIEFTVEDGRLWVLQTRVGKRTPQAAFRIAADLVREGIIDVDQALSRVTGDQLARLMFPSFDPGAERVLLTRGVNASPGAAVGRLVFDSPTAEAWVARGEDVILVREETDPDDLPGLIAARGVLTSRGGRTSHAAVVARGLGRTCVCGADELRVDAASRIVRVGDIELGEGDLVSLDGSTGEVFAGAVPVVDSRWCGGWREDPSRTTSSRPSHSCSTTRTSAAGSTSAPTPTRRPTLPARAGSAPRESGSAAPSTCSSVSGGPWSSNWCSRTASRNAPKRSTRCCPFSAATSRGS